MTPVDLVAAEGHSGVAAGQTRSHRDRVVRGAVVDDEEFDVHALLAQDIVHTTG